MKTKKNGSIIIPDIQPIVSDLENIFKKDNI